MFLAIVFLFRENCFDDYNKIKKIYLLTIHKYRVAFFFLKIVFF